MTMLAIICGSCDRHQSSTTSSSPSQQDRHAVFGTCKYRRFILVPCSILLVVSLGIDEFLHIKWKVPNSSQLKQYSVTRKPVQESGNTTISSDKNTTCNHDDNDSDDDYFHRSNRLPQWFYEYAIWHSRTVQNLTLDSYDQYQYVVLRCVRGDSKCYGTADRLKMIPVMLKLAQESQRILFIYWSRPFPIEEFLLPNTYYMNWTVPSFLIEPLQMEAVRPIWKLGDHGKFGMLDTASQGQQVIRIMSMTYASGYYDDRLIQNEMNSTSTSHNNDTQTDDVVELPMWEIYSDFWKAMFLPSPGVLDKIRATLQSLDLLAGTENIYQTHLTTLLPSIRVKPYISVHVRAKYKGDTTERHPEENAIRCATLLQQQHNNSTGTYSLDQPLNYASSSDGTNGSNTGSHLHSRTLPIYIASDTSIVTTRAIQYGFDHDLLVVGRMNSLSNRTAINSTSTIIYANPYHIDQPPSELVLQPSDFYDTFVDLYLLALGACHTWGSGGYGSWAAAIAPRRTITTVEGAQPQQNEPFCASIVHTKQRC
jgi:hypothetical protein